MKTPTAAARVPDLLSEQRLILRRFRLLAVFVLACMLILGWRFADLQLNQHAQHVARSDDNRIRLQALAPNRGLVLDRRGRFLAENRPAYRLVIVPERTAGLEETLDRLQALVAISDDERARFDSELARARPFSALTLKDNLDSATVARLAIDRHRFPGVDIEPHLLRHYPHGALFAHVVGYVGRIDEQDLSRLDADRYRTTQHIGKTGIERFFESALHGQPGLERVETNAQGRVLRVLERTDPQPGEDLTLTVDLDLQRAVSNALAGQPGAAVVLSVPGGEVLALVSQPVFDPNSFVHGMTRGDYERLLADPERPLFNRFLSGGYEPGSTIKPFIALAGLERGVVTPNTRVHSSGWFQLPGQERRYRDWRREGHGWINLRGALAESVNTYFYQVAVDLGIDEIARELALFGFGRPTGLDLPGEGYGVLPTRSWKRARLGEPWYPGETVITGIGQGFTVVTPLQLAHATAILAGRGLAAPPSLTGPGEAVRMVAHEDWVWDAVFEGMIAVVHDHRGSARGVAASLPVTIAGKTGTAQVFGLPNDPEDDEPQREQNELPLHLRNHALFIAFAPAESPRLALSVVVEHGQSGASVAAPVAAEIIVRALELGY